MIVFSRPITVAAAIAAVTVIILQAVGITTVTLPNAAVIAIILAALGAAVVSSQYIRGCGACAGEDMCPCGRFERANYALPLGIALIVFAVYLAIILPTLTGAAVLSLIALWVLLFLVLAIIITLLRECYCDR